MNSSQSPDVFLNRFRIKTLDESARTVEVYTYSFNLSPEQGKEYAAIQRIIWKLWKPAARLGNSIVTKERINEKYLQGDGWTLQHQGRTVLNPKNDPEREALERLERSWLEKQLRNLFTKSQSKIERSPEGGFIWWNKNKTILAKDGWEVHTGVRLDVVVNFLGILLIEMDTHHRFYTSWTLEQWLQLYPDFPIYYVRNTYNDSTWRYVKLSDENPEKLILQGIGTSLAQYHRNLESNPATEDEISQSRVTYVTNNRGQEISHLSMRLRPSITMENLSYLSSQGQREASQVFKKVRQSVQARFDTARDVTRWLSKKVYKCEIETIKEQKTKGTSLRNGLPILLSKQNNIKKTQDSLKYGCFRTGEKRFGCLDLVGNTDWSKTIQSKLNAAARNSGVEILLESPKTQAELPDTLLARRQFWENWSAQGTQTILVVSPLLGMAEKMKLRGEALEANIALQFMRPMPTPDTYRATNVILGLLVKAKWQPVGLEPLQDEYAADLAIGFDAGRNREMSYGTSAFAVLATGQSLGWELPEAQSGERLSEKVVCSTVLNLINRFYRLNQRYPKRILILRDGFIQSREFDTTLEALKQEKIAVDLLEVRKSGAGRMAIEQHDFEQSSTYLIDAPPGTAVLSQDGKTIRIVTSQARAGGSARPLQIVRDTGDAPLHVLAQQIDRLSQLHPASGSFSSRLPMVLHYADKMAKEVQRLGQVGILQNVDREKIFFV